MILEGSSPSASLEVQIFRYPLTYVFMFDFDYIMRLGTYFNYIGLIFALIIYY